MTSYLKIRFDTHDYDNIVGPFIDKYCVRFMYCFEGDDLDPTKEKSHIHLYAETKPFTKELALRAFLRRKGLTRKYSITECTPEPLELLGYMTKQNKFYHNLPEELIQEAIKVEAEKKEAYIKKKKSRQTVLQKIEESMKDYLELVQEGKASSLEIVDKIVDYYKEQGTLVREFALISQAQTLLLKYDPWYHKVLVNKVWDKISYNPVPRNNFS